MLVIEGTIRVRDVEAAKPVMRRMVEASRAEDGCVDYAYAFDLIDPNLVRISERWTTREALAAHAASAHLAAWRSHWPHLGISERSLRMYEGEPESI